LRVPSVDELCTNPHINDELSGIYSTFQWKSSEHLPRMLTEHQTQMMHEFLHSVMRAFCDLKIEWMIYYGSLLGAYITHDALPWDDDLDLILEERALRILAVEHKNGMLSARYNISYVITGGLHKLYWSPGKKIKPYSWAWPFMDIIAYNNSKEGFRNIDLSKGHQFKAKTDLVYPLHMRPFGPVWVPAPRDPWRMMGLTYKKGTREFLCSEPHYDHIRERGRKGAKKNACEDLHGDDRFVYREPKLDGALIETLKLGDETLYSIEYDMRMLIRTNGRGHRDN
ncbi:MAG: LicD family protein, partial [Kangiellaceae bacterium]|nr:LicD family protein [Kangiellaceae bacterium]